MILGRVWPLKTHTHTRTHTHASSHRDLFYGTWEIRVYLNMCKEEPEDCLLRMLAWPCSWWSWSWLEACCWNLTAPEELWHYGLKLWMLWIWSAMWWCPLAQHCPAHMLSSLKYIYVITLSFCSSMCRYLLEVFVWWLGFLQHVISVCRNMQHHFTKQAEVQAWWLVPAIGIRFVPYKSDHIQFSSRHPTGTQVIQVILMIGMIAAAIGLLVAFSWATYRTYNPTRTYGNSMHKSIIHGYEP